MKDFWKRTAQMAIVGFAAGMLVGMCFIIPENMRAQFMTQDAGWQFAYLMFSGVMGMLPMGTMTIYSIEHWSLAFATLTHFAITFAALCAMGGWLGWLRPENPVAWIMLLTCVVIYFIIWLIMYCSYKRQVRRMNEDLKHWKDTHK